jgi:hypothetical protein
LVIEELVSLLDLSRGKYVQLDGADFLSHKELLMMYGNNVMRSLVRSPSKCNWKSQPSEKKRQIDLSAEAWNDLGIPEFM